MLVDMAAIDELCETVRRLRAPGGCPWDQEQTHQSLSEHLISEAAELLEAIDNNDVPHIREELGDVLCQVVMHAQMASEAGHFDFEAVAAELNAKLVRRHPHVFGEEAGQLGDSKAVLQRWDEIKAEEKRRKGQPTDTLFKALPPQLPALLYARDIYKQMKKKDLPVPATAQPAEAPLTEAEAGEALFRLAAQCYTSKIDPEAALRRAATRLRDACTTAHTNRTQ